MQLHAHADTQIEKYVLKKSDTHVKFLGTHG